VGVPRYGERPGAVREAVKPRLPKSNFSNDRGVALVVVLWIFIFLFVVAVDFSASVREEATAVHRFSDDTQGYYLALAGFEEGLYKFLQPPDRTIAQKNQSPADLVDGNWREGTLGSGVYRVRLVDEGGKININRVDEDDLRRIFTHLGVEEPRRSVLVDSILDWRDADDLHRISGAESDYYLSLSQPYTAKNGPFDAVEELLWVRGITRSLYYGYAENDDTLGTAEQRVGLRDLFTVDSPMDRVNLRTASAEVIHALLGVPLEKSRTFVEEREKLSDKTLADLLQLLRIDSGDAALRMFVFTAPAMISVEAEGRHADSVIPRRLKGVIRVVGGNRGFELVRWVDRETVRPQL
jgi:general secretion pathway protein K